MQLYPNDPYQDPSNWPVSWGQLLNVSILYYFSKYHFFTDNFFFSGREAKTFCIRTICPWKIWRFLIRFLWSWWNCCPQYWCWQNFDECSKPPCWAISSNRKANLESFSKMATNSCSYSTQRTRLVLNSKLGDELLSITTFMWTVWEILTKKS